MEMEANQRDQIANQIFIDKMNAAFARGLPEFARLAPEQRIEFLTVSKSAAEAHGLKTEQGIAAYALAVWWLGLDFVNESKELVSLLESSYPEVRKVFAMNEWVNAMIGDPDDVGAADEKLREGLNRTEAWGR